jgi:large conductance mechanosensitive channel
MTELSQEEIRARALRTPKFVKEFRAFVLRGNVVDLAVGVVMGVAFGDLVKSLVANIITPLTGIFHKLPDFSERHWNLVHANILYGAFLNQLLSFLLVALIVFLFVVKPLNRVLAVTRSCPECLSSMPIAAKRCAACGIVSLPPGTSLEERAQP